MDKEGGEVEDRLGQDGPADGREGREETGGPQYTGPGTERSGQRSGGE